MLRRRTTNVPALTAGASGSAAASAAGAAASVVDAYGTCRLRSTRSRARFVACSRAVVRLVLVRPPSTITSIARTPMTSRTIATMISTMVKPSSPRRRGEDRR